MTRILQNFDFERSACGRSVPVALATPCASRHVVAVLVAADGRVFVGSNGVRRPQPCCPRKKAGYPRGRGWWMCREICGQLHHAEVDVLRRAGAAARGATLYLIGHDRACPECHKAMARAGVARLAVVADKDGRTVFCPLDGRKPGRED